MERFHFSEAECFENCPARWKFRYQDHLETIESDDPANALKLGTALHRGIETDLETALNEYIMSYPVITDEHINEMIKLEHWIPRVKELLPGNGLHEVQMQDEWYEGTMDYLVPCTKHDANLPRGQYDLYDFKYSNNKNHYMESRQLHVYKYFCEKILGKKIRKLFFVFVPKIQIKQKKTESLTEFRNRIRYELNRVDVEIKEVEYDGTKVASFLETCMNIQYADGYEKCTSYLCNWCEYKEYCLKGEDYMILPSNERRTIGQTTKRKLWIYGSAFSGKTTFVDQAPDPLNLNTDGNIQFVTMPYISIKDTMEGRQKILAWQNFKDTIEELEKKDNDFKTIVVDLLEDVYESCRLYMYDKLGITHESDDTFRAWDKVRTEFLSTIRRLMNLDYENIILISHEDSSKDITKKSGDKITSIKPNVQDKIARKVAGMVDIVARVVVEDDDSRTLSFKSNEVIFGGGRLKGVSTTSIPLDWNELCKVYDEANSGATASQPDADEEEKLKTRKSPRTGRKPKQDESDGQTNTDSVTIVLEEDGYFYSPVDDNYIMKHAGDEVDLVVAGQEVLQQITKEEFGEGVKKLSKAMNEPEEVPFEEDEAPKRTRRTRKVRS